MQLQQVPSLLLFSSFAAFFTGDKQAAVKQDKKDCILYTHKCAGTKIYHIHQTEFK